MSFLSAKFIAFSALLGSSGTAIVISTALKNIFTCKANPKIIRRVKQQCAQLFVNLQQGVFIVCPDVNQDTGYQFWLREQTRKGPSYSEIKKVKVSTVPSDSTKEKIKEIKVEFENLKKGITMSSRYIEEFGTSVEKLQHLNSQDLSQCKIEAQDKKPYITCGQYTQELRQIQTYAIPKYIP
ncbi:hypothetical protein OVS_04035 [Mycoplasma ovis str. Michigan]|uniref:Uncharacterized protein n=1 Tax=Mycoplasma ovis str. Michigan TaxID=1415773 RepID=A0ABN4BSL5_9MOLU|nr:hypothetical protein [Mycoplasma ovis]AHC40538.1 hypothetical protein OVS_04035 [Mycoplasma ovis str. Michigan]